MEAARSALFIALLAASIYSILYASNTIEKERIKEELVAYPLSEFLEVGSFHPRSLI